MNATELTAFTNPIKKFYLSHTQVPISIETAYLSDEQRLPLLEYTAEIKYSGLFEGYAYFAAPHAMLLQTAVMTGDTRNNKEAITDLLNKICIQIANGSKSYFGGLLQVDSLGMAKRDFSTTTLRPYIIRLAWRNQYAMLILDLTESAAKSQNH